SEELKSNIMEFINAPIGQHSNPVTESHPEAYYTSRLLDFTSEKLNEVLESEGLSECMVNLKLLESSLKLQENRRKFCILADKESINIETIDEIISIGSPLEYNRFLLQEEIYSLLIKKCPEIKYLNICGTYEILYLPEAKAHLESLYELTCDTLIDPKYFYGLAHICQQIQRIIIINKNVKVNHGTTKLLEFQKNLKYFRWVDEFKVEVGFHYWELLVDPYTEIFNVLKKHANTLNHFQFVSYSDNYNNDGDYTFLQDALLGLHNLKIIKINSPLLSNNDDFNNELEMMTFRNLEFIEIEFIYIYQVNYIIKNSLFLRELKINYFYTEKDSFNDDSLNFIRTIYENCFLIEYLTIPMFPLLENYFIEFEKLLKRCQNLRSLYFIYTSCIREGNEFEYWDYLSNVLIKEASTNLKEIGIPFGIRFSLETLEAFFEKWKGRPAISIYLVDFHIYQTDSYRKLINKYKIEGVVKDINV
ncbi:19561_t:CDS:2, partial [Rhizophagus irregularis]